MRFVAKKSRFIAQTLCIAIAGRRRMSRGDDAQKKCNFFQ
jgi:hypothetical protein